MEPHLYSVLPERLYPGGDETPVGNIELRGAQCLVIPVVDGQDVRQLKEKQTRDVVRKSLECT
jgi:hypothetical protein